MGCTASKLDNEDTVRRCKERRRLIKDAVYARHHLASAHSDYLHSLRVTGSALSRFAAAEPLSISDLTPPVLLHHSPSLSSSSILPPTPHPPPRPPIKINTTTTTTNASTPLHKPTRSAASPSQASSVWDWENFYPPTPPGSDFFDRRRTEIKEHHHHHHLPRSSEDDADEEREEVHCSEWAGGDVGSTTTDSSARSRAGDDEDEAADADSRSEEIAARSTSTAPSAAKSEVRSPPRDENVVVRHRDLAEIAAAVEEYFEKAAAAGEVVSELLEAGRAQFERSFRQLKKTVYHSNSVLSALASTWTSKPPLAIRYRLDTGALEATVGGATSHGATLEQLLAWERKLYEEVKAREGVKIEHEKKLSTLQNQEYKGRDESKIDKTKASIQKLQSLIIVTSQAVSTTSSAINRTRDNELAEQIVEICYGLLNMWRSMNGFHEVQNQIVQQVRGLINHFSGIGGADSTSDLHRLATRELEAAISSWHSSFNRLIKYQRDYARSVYGWLKLTQFPVSSDGPVHKEDHHHSTEVSAELTIFCDELKQALDRLPDTVASEAISSFVNVVHVISAKQAEELKIKKLAEACSRELEKKTVALRAIEKKFYHSYSAVGVGLTDDGGRGGEGQVFDARDPLADKKADITAYRRKVEEGILRHGRAVEATRSMTLNNIQTGLPGVFQAMTGFSGLFAEALQGVCRRAGSVSEL